ncbi:hypothetical protein F0562_017055 [Nyssa sinensis]|uniref:Fe2OG dioxygenase domain-containing protein n=1 Tax=Nyssa sinensis TaxID=561372 RepID=A0A5J4ZHN0_9ASTE|nr:hypothetical protein F0562_017055 [Nyssa sinensis]
MAAAAAASATVGYDRMKEVKEFDNSKIGVKGLSDSGIATIPKFFVHPPETLSDLKSSSACAGIPVIDLSGLKSQLDRPKIVEQIREAARTWGFFQVINHGVPVSVLDETIAAIKAFHEQPTEVKANHYIRQEGHGVMYASNYDLYRSKAATWLDSLNVWMSPVPAKVEDIPAVCRREAGGVGHACQDVLLQNQVEGLQVKHGHEWVDVKPLHGGLIINIGDSLQIISNDEYTSAEHRLLANSSEKSRISIVEFFHADNRDVSSIHGPLPELLSAEKPAVYRNFTMGEFIENFSSKGLDSKSLVQKLKL